MSADRLRAATQKVFVHFISRDAYNARRAITFVTDEPLEGRVLARFLDCGVLTEVEPRTYYLDRAEYERWARTAQRRAKLAVLVFVIITIALLVLALSAVFGR